MKKVKIKYSQLIFLYAYLRLIDLSLDRSRWSPWSELQIYFKNVIAPYQIIQYLKTNFKFTNEDIEQVAFSLKKKTTIDKFISTFFNRFLLKQDEVLYCCKLLLIFEKIIISDKQNYNLEVEKLRIDIAEYYTKILGQGILHKDLNRIMRIEHFAQNDINEVLSLKEFVPVDFLFEI